MAGNVTTATLIAVAVLALLVAGFLLRRVARLAMFIAVSLFLGLAAYYVWPTPYRFFSTSGSERPDVLGYRENRLTGSVDALTPHGWVPLGASRGKRSSTSAGSIDSRAPRDSADLLLLFERERRRARDSAARAMIGVKPRP